MREYIREMIEEWLLKYVGTQTDEYGHFITAEISLGSARYREMQILTCWKHLVDQKSVFACPLGHLFTYMKGEDFKKPEKCVKVQIICKRRYSDVADLINSFDFSATYFAMLWNDDETHFEVYTDHRAIKDVRKKQLSLVNLEYPSSTLNRIYKYRNKGYYTGHVIKEIVARIAQMGGSYDPENDTLYVD